MNPCMDGLHDYILEVGAEFYDAITPGGAVWHGNGYHELEAGAEAWAEQEARQFKALLLSELAEVIDDWRDNNQPHPFAVGQRVVLKEDGSPGTVVEIKGDDEFWVELDVTHPIEGAEGSFHAGELFPMSDEENG